MKGRDLLILAAVLLVIGLAVADSLRSDESRVESRPTTSGPEAPPSTTTTPGEEDVLGRESFPPVTGARGAIILVQTGSCAVREFDLPTGLELPNVVARSTCELWAAPVTANVAVGIGEPVGDAVPFRFVDLSHPNRDLGSSEAAFGFLVWSEDGQRAAWCNRRLEGIDLEVGSSRRRLPDCPAAYTPDGEVAYALEDRLVTEERELLQATGGITHVHVGSDGSAGIVVEGRRIERYVGGRLADALDLSDRFEGQLPALSPDNCSAAFRAGNRIRILDLGCSNYGGEVFRGRVAAWSPEGDWLAVGEPDQVTFVNLPTGGTIRWPIGAVQLAWRRG